MSEDRANPGGAALHPQGESLSPSCAMRSPADSSLSALADHEPFMKAAGSGGLPCRDQCYEIMVDGSGDGHSIALFPGEEVFFAYERGASNNDAEFNAVILALENLPPRAHARIRTDSQVVVWHLSATNPRRRANYIQKKAQIEEIIAARHLKVEIQWIPRRENRADRFLKHYIESLCGARGREPLHRRVRRLEVENLRLKTKLAKAMNLLEKRPVVVRDTGGYCMFHEQQ
ncbi:MAG TPA: hypothetical protein PKM87_08220 [Methanolinea sp.]|nr:hypothetical protein [Methanolinea sp.]